MDGTTLERVTETIYLGVTFTCNLSWTRHIEKSCSSANRVLGFLWRTMHKCPKNLREKAFNSLVRSRLDYGATVWDPHQTTSIKKLEAVQRRGARFVFGSRHRRSLGKENESPTEMLRELGWPPLEVRRRQARLGIYHKIINQRIEIPTSYLPNPKLRSGAKGTFHAAANSPDEHRCLQAVFRSENN